MDFKARHTKYNFIKESQYAEVVTVVLKLQSITIKLATLFWSQCTTTIFGMCLKNMEDYDGALKYHEISLKIRKNIITKKGSQSH